MLKLRRSGAVRLSRGMSLVELLVGVVVGLFIVGGASYFAVNFNSENRRLLLEARLTQDMRAAMDIMTRDLRRAGYWANAASGTSIFGSAAPTITLDATGYASITPAAASGVQSAVTYRYAKDADNAVNSNTEQFGFALANGVLTTTIGGSGAQPLTDANTTFVDTFTVTAAEAEEDITCPSTCTVNCPKIYIREMTITLTANSTADASVRRTLKNQVRLRNDRQTGACP
jgi:prepilin peptidase dependent protein B